MLTDKQYISGMMRKDEKVFELFVNQYKNYVYTICLGIIKQSDIAEEAAQDTFIKVFHSIQSFKEEAKLSSWMYRIAYRTSLDYLKKRKLHPIDMDDYASLPDDTQIDQSLHHRELIELVKNQILKLSPIDATVVNLFYFEQKSIREIIDITDLTETNIKSKLFRCRKWLRKTLSSTLQTDINTVI